MKPTEKIRPKRMSGILVHPTSFPSPYGIGDLGPGAYEFIAFLKKSGQHLWQVLPLGPTGFEGSPYQSFSSFAGQPLLISPEKLVEEGLLTREEAKPDEKLKKEGNSSIDRVDYPAVEKAKEQYLRKAFVHFKEKLLEEADEAEKKASKVVSSFSKTKESLAFGESSKTKENLDSNGAKEVTKRSLKEEYEEFLKENAFWVDDYALFMAIKEENEGLAVQEWKQDQQNPTEKQKKEIREKLEEKVNYQLFIQFIFFKQWHELKKFANDNDIYIIGDIPIYVSRDSSDVWSHPELFYVEEDLSPTLVAGVPPDYFSATGQLWGNPLYKWEVHKKTKFAWWISRIQCQLQLCDYLRIDHFRAFEDYWEVEADAKTAIDGRWVPGPRDDFFFALQDALGKDLPIIAEDLGIITDSVRELRDRFDLPGMKILQFGFENIYDNDFMPYHHPVNSVCYTGTHDNDTTVGWYQKVAPVCQDKVRRYMNTDGSSIHWDFIRTCFGSPANMAIVPIQDIFGQGSEFRMNVPGVALGNWGYRFQSEQLNDGLADYVKQLSILYGRG